MPIKKNAKKTDCKVTVSKNGPYLISGKIPLEKEIIRCDSEGNPSHYEKGEKFPVKDSFSLCRCGNSKKKPFCDGTHSKTGFDGTETAKNTKYSEMAEKIIGPELILNDAQDYCSGARFCHREGNVWQLTRNSGDKKAKKIAIEEACDCSSGRLIAEEKTGKKIEPKFSKSISLLEDPSAGVSGPIKLKGGISLESDSGKKYETRNRVTLCRCGQSENKPFCNGNHIDANFSDGDKTIKKIIH